LVTHLFTFLYGLITSTFSNTHKKFSSLFHSNKEKLTNTHGKKISEWEEKKKRIGR
jgi:hypothetical protein